ncbi:ribosome recycling factor [Candidatus Kaiserbacteria bacterium RIFCSPHIGHO2_01_FULL_48_10]|uniref:Ribosome recycling factor n=1 Tax=Candidatus Kaiserbacteria bacterium RIFCSPHIGHO2_01_FULL_48_10 TaxID=1798476 RepID=A0A1F6C554_9BACT|nr:MAG: ribosome recycling factor [Candidatus Kaiserbacteria bacterium RIFCSPHIGHO2_01_FULL_48_10]
MDLSSFKKTANEKTEWLSRELQGLRTGRATPALLDGVSVEVYGSRMKLAQIASITVEDARSLYVNPWDKGQTKEIEKAIVLADLGVSAGSDDKGVRVSFPELTQERRQQLIKLVGAKLEEARVALRGERGKAMADIDAREKGGTISEDDAKRAKADAQKIVDEVNAKLEELAEKKERELQS